MAGGGILSDTLSIYALILSKCFSQKCCTVSLIGYGSNTLIRWLEFELFELEFELIIVTLVLLRRDVTITAPGAALVLVTPVVPVMAVVAVVVTDTCPSAVCRDAVGINASEDLPEVSGFTDMDWLWRGAPEIIVAPMFCTDNKWNSAVNY